MLRSVRIISLILGSSGYPDYSILLGGVSVYVCVREREGDRQTETQCVCVCVCGGVSV